MRKSKESSPSSPSSPSSEKWTAIPPPPTIEEQVEKLGDVMKICGIKAGAVIRELRDSYSAREEVAGGLCPIRVGTGEWQQLTIALFQEACGVKHLYGQTSILLPAVPELREIAKKLTEL